MYTYTGQKKNFFEERERRKERNDKRKGRKGRQEDETGAGQGAERQGKLSRRSDLPSLASRCCWLFLHFLHINFFPRNLTLLCLSLTIYERSKEVQTLYVQTLLITTYSDKQPEPQFGLICHFVEGQWPSFHTELEAKWQQKRNERLPIAAQAEV